ncbi:MAG: hypothetical protein ACM3SS_20730 [Rhodospirillaceae bacterium]
MLRRLLVSLVFGLSMSPIGATAMDAPGKPAGPAQKDPGQSSKPADPLGRLKPYEERRYRMDMQDCGKEKGVERRLCERTVRNKAAAKSRRRAAGH